MPRIALTRIILPLLLLLASASRLTAQCSPEWSAEFPTNDLFGIVYAWAEYDDGSGPAVYASGVGSLYGGGPSVNVFKWTAAGWVTVGGGTNGAVHALAVFDDGSGPALYAAGAFTVAGGGLAQNIAKWNGSAWSPVGGGIGQTVRALAVYDDGSGPALYAGGEFTAAGGQPASRIAKLTGSGWTPLGSGLNGTVHALAAFNPGTGAGLYVGGEFAAAGGVPAQRVARWNGSSWSALGPGLPSTPNITSVVRSLKVYNDGLGTGESLYVGGAFEIPQPFGEPSIFGVARWTGAGWAALGTSNLRGDVHSMSVFPTAAGADLYVAGQLIATSPPIQHVGRWNGVAWSGLGDVGPSDRRVFALGTFMVNGSPRLFVGGNIEQADGIPVRVVCSWTGSAWAPLGNGASGGVNKLVVRNEGTDALYAGGNFLSVGSVRANRVARWDGSQWSALGGGVEWTTIPSAAFVSSMAFFDNGSGPALYVGGQFNRAGGQPATNIARWSGGAWSPVGPGLDGAVYALAVHDDGAGPALYAGGDFSLAGTTGVVRVARWDGAAWSRVSTLGMNGAVFALQSFDPDGPGPAPAQLYAGGAFTQAGGAPALRIARWDGAAWSQTGAGFDSSVSALAVHDDGRGGPALYAGGNFSWSGAAPVSRIARWNGSAWGPLGAGINGQVSALATFNDGSGPLLVAGGNFLLAGPALANSIARWNGTDWAPFGPGSTAPVAALAVGDLPQRKLFVGGPFRSAGGVSAGGLAVIRACNTCYANCDGSTVAPILNVNDFACFLNRYSAADPYANCDGSTVPPVLNINDFSCFVNRFASGCP